jgi:hypothetical protein
MALVKVYTARDTPQAHFVRSLLEQEGIDATVLGDQLALAIGGIPATRGTLPAVWVAEESADAARDVVARYERREPVRPTTATPWVCPQCGETIEPQFTDCWNCGTARPEDAAAPREPDEPKEVGPIPADVPCVGCGYNLRGLHPAGRCPECGAAIVPSLLALLRVAPPDAWDEADDVLRATIAPAAARIDYLPQAVLFVMDGWLRALAEVEPPEAGVGLEPSGYDRRTFATCACRAIVHHAIGVFGGSEEAVDVLRGWKLATCEAIATVVFAMIAQGFLEPVPYLREDDFPRGSVELLLPS